MSDDGNSADPLPESRRERGKIAQREYRKRHAHKFKYLQEENTKLKDAIRAISAAASASSSSGQGLSAELISALSAARDAAGLDDEEPLLLPSPPESSKVQQDTPMHDDQDDPSQGFDVNSTLFPRPGPRLWMGDTMHIPLYTGPPDCQMYMGKQMFTIAGRIYWDYITHIVLRWRKYVLTSKHSAARINAQLGQMTDDDMLVAMANLRSQNWQKGYDYQNWNDTIGNSVSPAQMTDLALCVRDNTRREGDLANNPKLWKTAQEVEQYFKDNLSSEMVELVNATAEGTANPDIQQEFGAALSNLARNAVCFGDGPRWNVFYLSMAVGSWVTHLKENGPIMHEASGRPVPETTSSAVYS